MINLSSLNLRYRQLNNPSLKNINLKIQSGEKILIVGPSGSGKSTLGKLLNGLIPNSQLAEIEGENFVEDLKLGESSIFELSQKIGTIMQDQDAQFVGLTVAEDIAFYLENLNVEVDQMHMRVDEIIQQLGLEEIKNIEPIYLSGGEKQKVSVAGVLVNDVNCLLLDEPLANLDPETAVEVMQLIKRLNQDFSKTIIMIEHRLEDALCIDFDRIVVMDQGKIIADDCPTAILRSDILKKIGIQRPLYIEALDNLNYDFSGIKNILDFSEFCKPQLPIIKVKESKKDFEKELAFSACNLSLSFEEHQVLKDLSFDIYKSEIVSLLGSNGAGKSSLCHSILGIYKDYQGTFELESQPIDKMGIFERAKQIAYVMQNPNHYITETTVEEELEFSLKDQNLSTKEKEEEIDKSLESCRLTKYKKWPINMLSYGQKRRVTIAACLLKRPKLLILDEPTAGQDFANFKAIMDIVKSLRKKYNLSILIITHNMQLAYEYSERALVLNQGKIIFNGKIEKLYEEKELLKAAHLRTTSIQDFSHYHQISSYQLGQALLRKEQI
ncbi:MAG: ABC transporter ATP-binding protein [Lactovum sp.]